MLTYLDLCNLFITELGINGGQKLDTVSTNINSVESIRVTQMIADADFEIQCLHHNWKFLWRQFRDMLAAGGDVLGSPVGDVQSNDSSNSQLLHFGYYAKRIDRNSLVFNYDSTTISSRPVYQDWRVFESMWQSRGAKSVSNSPPFWSIDPAGNAIVSTVMADATPYQYECWAKPKRMRSDADLSPVVVALASSSRQSTNFTTPHRIPQPSGALTPTPAGVIATYPSRGGEAIGESCRLIIVRAKAIWAEVEGATEIMQGCMAEYQDLLEAFRADQLPHMEHDRVSTTDVYLTVETV